MRDILLVITGGVIGFLSAILTWLVIRHLDT